MKNIKKKVVTFAVLGCLFIANTVFASQSYGGTVYKYADYESTSAKKADSTEKGTNNASKKSSGSIVCWLEFAESKSYYHTGTNCTDKTSYTTTGKKYMKYQDYIDADGNIAAAVYEDEVALKLNISTSLTNFTSGTVSGYWSPDTY